MVEYVYAITDFLNDKMAPCSFIAEIEASAIGEKPAQVSVSDDGSQVTVEFPSAINQSVLDAVVAAHAGDPLPQTPRFHASSKLVEQERDITQTDWEDVGGVVTNPWFFMLDALKAMGRVIGDVQSDGTVDGRVVLGDTPDVVGTFQIADTSGAWARFSYTTDPGYSYPTEETLFRLQMKRGTASAAKVRYTSLILLEALP